MSRKPAAEVLVHIAQGTLEQFRSFRLLYGLLAEGLAKYLVGYRLIELLVAADEGCIGDLLRLNNLPLVLGDVEAILANPHLADYSRDLLSTMAERIRDSIRTAVEADITDPTFVTLGEEVRAWRFLLDRRFEPVREEVDRVVEEWFGVEKR